MPIAAGSISMQMRKFDRFFWSSVPASNPLPARIDTSRLCRSQMIVLTALIISFQMRFLALLLIQRKKCIGRDHRVLVHKLLQLLSKVHPLDRFQILI